MPKKSSPKKSPKSTPKKKSVHRATSVDMPKEPAPMKIPEKMTPLQRKVIGMELRWKDESFKELFDAAGKKG